MDWPARLAEVAVRVGVGLQPGQTLFVHGEAEHAPLARAIAEAGWRADAGDVHVLYVDAHLRRLRAIHAPEELLDATPGWIEEETLATEGGAVVTIMGDVEPDLFADVDPRRAARTTFRSRTELRRRLTRRGLVAWTVVPCPTQGWARSLFGVPDVERLWEEIAVVNRLDRPDPATAWREHVAMLAERGRLLDERRLTAVRFRGPGTDLTVGMIPGARWLSAEETTAWGQVCVPNLPTEEVFTTPDRLRTEGTVRLTVPVHWFGSTVEDASLRFEGGRAVEVRAARGEDFLRSKLAVDAGAPYLGEVALVDVDSAVGRRGLVFKNGLLDENASSHIALGAAYTDPVAGSEEWTEEQRLEERMNVSSIHLDVMIGGPEIDVDGLDATGAEIPILRQGHWVLR